MCFFGAGAGDSAVTVAQIDNIVAGFKIWRLPVKYLRVPFITGKLIVNDCRPFLDSSPGSKPSFTRRQA